MTLGGSQTTYRKPMQSSTQPSPEFEFPGLETVLAICWMRKSNNLTMCALTWNPNPNGLHHSFLKHVLISQCKVGMLWYSAMRTSLKNTRKISNTVIGTPNTYVLWVLALVCVLLESPKTKCEQLWNCLGSDEKRHYESSKTIHLKVSLLLCLVT